MAKKYFDSIPVVDAKALNNSLTGSINVKHYGAVGDGVVDDTISIQSALDAINTAGGGTLYFQNGIYKSDKLTVHSNTTIIGQSRENTIIKLIDAPSGALFDCSGVSGTNKKYISFLNLRMKHIDQFAEDGDKGILIKGSFTELCSVKNCIFDTFSQSAIFLSDISVGVASRSWQIYENIFDCIGHNVATKPIGIHCYLAGEYAMISNNFFNYLQHAVKCNSAANVIITNNSINQCVTGIKIINTGYVINYGKNIIVSNTINHNASAIEITCQNNSGGLAKQSGCVVESNIILFPGACGIYILSGYGHLITNNKILTASASTDCINIADATANYPVDYCIVKGNMLQCGGINVTGATVGENNDFTGNYEVPV